MKEIKIWSCNKSGNHKKIWKGLMINNKSINVG